MNKSRNKGQAALEFLMTYGWAMLVVLAAVGALAYMGVLSPQKYVNNKCTSSVGISCQGEPQFNQTQLAFTVLPSTGFDLAFSSVSPYVSNISSIVGTPACNVANTYICTKGIVDVGNAGCALANTGKTMNDQVPYTIVCNYGPSGLTVGDSKKYSIKMSNVKDPQSGLNKDYTVDLTGKIA